MLDSATGRRDIHRTVRFALLVAAIACAGGCRIQQVPADGQPYSLRYFGDRYAVVVDASAQPLGVWDLAYPNRSRHDFERHPERFKEKSYPTRIVNFVKPDEMDRILRRERWRYGVGGWFGGVLTFGVVKWFVNTDFFEVREVRTAERAMLRQYLLMFTSERNDFPAAGLDAPQCHAAMTQLRQIEPDRMQRHVVENSRRLRARVRDDLRTVLERVASKAKSALKSRTPYAGTFSRSAWARLDAALPDERLPDDIRGLSYPTDRQVYAEVYAAARRGLAVLPWSQVQVDRFGEAQHLALVWVELEGQRLPFGVYELGFCSEPRLVFTLMNPFDTGPFLINRWISFTVNEIGAVLIFAIDEFATGLPVPVVGLTLSTITSIWPTAAFRNQDKLVYSRAQLLTLTHYGSDPTVTAYVPDLLLANHDEVTALLERDMEIVNKYWPAPAQVPQLIRINRQKLDAGCPGTAAKP